MINITTPMCSKIWCTILIYSALLLSDHCCVVDAAYSWSCSLKYLPVVNIPLSPSQKEVLMQKLQNVSDEEAGKDGVRRRRFLRATSYQGTSEGSNSNAIRYTRADNSTEESVILSQWAAATEADEPIYPGRRCACAADMLNTNDEFYCPSPTDYCSVLFDSGSSDRVNCFKHTDWKIGFARHVWYYLCFSLLFLTLYPIFSKPGQHAVRYVISKCCFPRMNPWLAEQLLQAETDALNLLRTEYERGARAQRRMEGLVSGYSLKTKQYSSAESMTADEEVSVECDTQNPDVETDDAKQDESNYKIDTTGDDEQTTRKTPQDQGSVRSNEEHNMCTICLLEVEDGERIAVLSCGHLYHADCLGEWILKKNACPLCASPNIAKEIRSFEPPEDDNNTQGDTNEVPSRCERIISRVQQQVRDTCLDIATDRNSWVRHINVHRVRVALDEE